jgi:hypothetical protein
MIPFALIGLMGLALSAGGIGLQYSAAQDANRESKKQTEIQRGIEDMKKRQMDLETRRQRREIFRRTAAAQAQTLATATNQGAQDSSALPGALGMAANQAAFAIQGVNFAQQAGESMYRANSLLSDSRERQADAGMQAQMGAGLQSLGGKVMSAGPTFNKLIGLI